MAIIWSRPSGGAIRRLRRNVAPQEGQFFSVTAAAAATKPTIHGNMEISSDTVRIQFQKAVRPVAPATIKVR